MRLSRAKVKNSSNKSNGLEILEKRSGVSELFEKNKLSAEVKQKLIEGEVLKHKVVTTYKQTRSRTSKQEIRQMLENNETLSLPSKFSNKVRNLISYKPRKKNLQKHKKRSVIRQTVAKFYKENSQIRPGKRDCITKNKIKKQSCYLNGQLKTLYLKFCTEYPNIKISYAFFARLRPFWIIPRKSNTRDTCLCITHENMNLLIRALSINDVIKEKKYQDVIASIVCDSNNENCMLRKCEKCINKKVQFNSDKNKSDKFPYKKWVTRKEKRISVKTKKEITVQITSKETFFTNIKEIEQNFHPLLFNFMGHIQRIHHQSETMKNVKATLTDNDLYILMDWSENYLCKYSHEPQAMHFGASRDQISLHTGMIYSKDFSRGFCTYSKSTQHDAPAIIAHLKSVIDYALTIKPSIKHLHLQSDGPLTQYRNKSLFYLICEYLSQMYSNFETIIYNYTETGHGKSAADGIGGAIKRLLDALVNYGHDISNYDVLTTTLQENCKNYFTAAISEQSIITVQDALPKTLKAFNGTLKVHQFKWHRAKKDLIRFNEMSCYKCQITEKCKHYHLGEMRFSATQTNCKSTKKSNQAKAQCKSTKKLNPSKAQSKKCKTKIHLIYYNI